MLYQVRTLKEEAKQLSAMLNKWQNNLQELEASLLTLESPERILRGPTTTSKMEGKAREARFERRREQIHEAIGFFETNGPDENAEKVVEALKLFECSTNYKWKTEFDVEEVFVPAHERAKFAEGCLHFTLKWRDWREKVHDGWPGTFYEEPASPTYRDHVTLTMILQDSTSS